MKQKKIYKTGDIVVVRQISFDNNVGGTEVLNGKFRVQLANNGVKDYETGRNFLGQLIDEKDIEKARKQGTTKFTPAHYANLYGKESQIYIDTLKAAMRFNPARVYISEFDIED